MEIFTKMSKNMIVTIVANFFPRIWIVIYKRTVIYNNHKSRHCHIQIMQSTQIKVAEIPKR